MRRSTFVAGLAAATIFPTPRANADSVAPDVDGIVIRGVWRAYVTCGAPALTMVADDDVRRAILMSRQATTLTVVRPASPPGERIPELRVSLARLRGVATSGAVTLTIEDSSDVPLFLDLAGSGEARAEGSVPLLRVTTSGSVDARLTDMRANVARAHARQSSRLAIGARDSLTIAALDAARVRYAGTANVHLTTRGAATIARL